jgi:putative NADPH-quinone reductase
LTISLGEIDVPILRTREEWIDEPLPASVQPGQEAIRWADHIVFFYPLWHGDMPALLKAWLEHVMRPGFALDYGGEGKFPKKLLTGRSARVVVTMGMPAFFYRAYYAAHSVRSFKRNILIGCGIDPVESSLIGNVEGSAGHRDRWLGRMHSLGVAGE